MTFEASLASAALGSVRVIGLFAVAPIFAHPAVPIRIRVALSMVTSLALGMAITPPIAELDPIPLMHLAFGELLIGLVLGKPEGLRAVVSQQDVPGLVGPAVLREGRWKYYHRPGSEQSSLFDLETDPGERHDLSRRHAAKANELRGRLMELLDERPAAATARLSEVEPELRRQLDSLGYLEE